ncbi:type II toxin-antitoxin system prevent-host-death family antitoxin [Aceticella autotrophica]|uniref:Antitoxin n=1 Tax=Aceticella autotrophica TaxID=2755338 RepID=A0A975AWJ2_9THEO|nr:type II toxin-antitoxin system prevent-host-death family antitoxin [Aceticella autotrophica]MDI6603814.1 type II toxin-antitoxin system prevent-host-death family antitoxin [Thermoanaerobacteraceae bacterium]QSZ27784.1 type II toxin-antitoxin system prevent-host-death family antitoxin [Aceticella autotrophica]
MLAVNYSNARQKFKEYCDIANKDYETIIITRKRGGNVVMLSEEEYNNIMENLFVRSDKKAYERLLKSMDQLKAGKASQRELDTNE